MANLKVPQSVRAGLAPFPFSPILFMAESMFADLDGPVIFDGINLQPTPENEHDGRSKLEFGNLNPEF